MFTSIDAGFYTYSVGSFLQYILSTGVKRGHLKRIVVQSLVARGGDSDLALQLMFGKPTVVVVVVEASAPKVYSRMTLTSVSTFSGSVVRTLRGGEGLPNMFCLVASSLGHLRSQCSIVCGSALQRGHRGSADGSRRLA